MTRRSPKNNDDDSEDPNNDRERVDRPSVVALFVGGWSPGPLVYLESLLRQKNIFILQPKNLPMPPFPSGSWCCHPKTIVLVGGIGVFLWLTFRPENQHWSYNLLSFLAVLVMCRIAASIVVQTSIEIGAQNCLEAIKPYYQQQHEHDNTTCQIIFVGFSWGGAVLAELLAQNRLPATIASPQQHPPPTKLQVLLIAPTTSLVASIIGYGKQSKDAALRILQDRYYYNDHPNVNIQVVHGAMDAAFCPNQSRWEGGVGNVHFHLLRDNHVFFHPQSQQQLVELLSQLVGSES